MACLLLRHEPDWPRRVLLIGLGAGSLAKFIYQHRPNAHITAVEIDDRIPPIAHQHFRLPIDPKRLRIVIADGADHIEQTHNRYDAIFLDGFGPNAQPGRLNTVDFYTACRSRLTQDGLLVSNLLSRNRGYATTIERIRQIFNKRAVVFPSLDSGNAIIFAASGETIDVSLEEMRLLGKQLKIDTGLDLRSTISRLQHAESIQGGHLRL